MLVSLQTCAETTDLNAIQKAADFVQAFILGFAVEVYIISEASIYTLL